MDNLIENLKVQLIKQLNLEEIELDEIDEKEPLFGDGLGLDSIDALEIIVLLEKEYGIKLNKEDNGKSIMYSIETLARYIRENSNK